MRGKLPGPGPGQRTLGLIPAYAGKTHGRGERIHVDRAHPRVCGENKIRDSARFRVAGSSPRMRGKLAGGVIGVQYAGLIPAYAGKTCGRRHRRPIRRAHPRVCGENCAWCLMWAGRGGSSPRMRGKPGVVCRRRGLRGLIPAYAGKTGVGLFLGSCDTAHPRVCGENIPLGTPLD